ncbi:MAG: hypothetical protein QOE90_898 [Thermoplasmata archaeon]|jgi:hypothetical protein|nr:hypothetical protein [Thermoplasmata archaeon]
MRTFAILTILATLALLPVASAHMTAYSSDNKWKFVYGFLNEPSSTYTKNGLDLRVFDNATGALLPGLESNLTASLTYTNQTFTFSDFGGQFGKPGYYTGTVTPTAPGTYKLHLTGSINGSAVDVTIPPKEDVHELKDSFFPKASSPADQDARIAVLESQVQALQAKLATQASTPATVQPSATPAKGVPGFEVALTLGVLAVLGAIVLRRRG